MEWISLKDKKPKLDQVVLVAHRKSTKRKWHIETAFRDSERNGGWYSNAGDQEIPIESSVDLWFVYYWMPLPKDPI